MPGQSSSSPSKSSGVEGSLPPNKRTISLPSEVPTFTTTTATATTEGDWRQKLQLESNHGNDVLYRMAGGDGMNNTSSFRGQYFGSGENASAAAGAVVHAGMTNNDDSTSPTAAAGGASSGSSSEREQMEAELKRMQKENEDLIRLISSRQQQLGGAAAGGNAGMNMNDNNAVDNTKGVEEGDATNQLKIGTSGNSKEEKSTSSPAAGAGAAAGGASSISLSPSATGGGMNMNSAAMMGGMMMGMNTNNMNMIMYNSAMMGGMIGMMNFNNNSMMNPYSMAALNNNNTNSLMLPSSSSNTPKKSPSSPNNKLPHNNTTIPAIELTNEDPNWEERYTELQHFKSEHGHTRVPARYKSNPKLGRWVMTQRRQFTVLMQGFPSALTTERMNRLNDVGFAWALRADPVTMWNRKFGELKGYKRLFGNCMVPQRYQPNPKLGTWVHTQRRQYKLMLEGKKSAMNNEKIAALDSIGFFWMAKQKDGGAVAVGETHHGGGGVAIAAPPLLPGMGGKSEGYGEEVDEGDD
mmetsp:Transcript_17831/g.25268  ORF Transcript_17831/g.25268 Transcript_17831/m.25268 type:complete len:522 (-) Transcript_17831:123-1688(-)